MLKEHFPWKKPGGPQEGFAEAWFAVLREISLRYGRNVLGWWIDGCYPSYAEFASPHTDYCRDMAAALRAGNPDSMLAFNCGIYVDRVSAYQDFTAGEMTVATEYEVKPCYDLQWHALGHLGPQWGSDTCAVSNRALVSYVREVTRQGGALSYDIHLMPDGTICPKHYDQLAVLHRYFEERDESAIPENEDYLAGTATLPHSDPIPDDFISIAVGKEATCSSYYSLDTEQYPPYRAFDGRLDTGWAAGAHQCQNIWLQVDLGEEYPLAGVKLWSVPERKWSHNNFEIIASQTPDFARYEVLMKQGNFPMPLDKEWSAVFDRPIPARYVRFRTVGICIPFVPELSIYIKGENNHE